MNLRFTVQAPESSAAQKAPEVQAVQEVSMSAAAAASSASTPASGAAPKTLTPIGKEFRFLSSGSTTLSKEDLLSSHHFCTAP
jgi:hypothetical protein